VILIVDEERRKIAYSLRDSLRGSGIPSVVTDSGNIKKYPEALGVIVFAANEGYLNKVSLYCLKIPVLAVNESPSRIYNKDVMFYDERFHDSYMDFVMGFLRDRYGILPEEYGCGDVLIKGDDVLVGFAYLKLTRTEKNILSLLTVCAGKWVSSETVRSTCFDSVGKKNSSRVSVHICNINKKASVVCGRNLIRAKRGIGYMLDQGI